MFKCYILSGPTNEVKYKGYCPLFYSRGTKKVCESDASRLIQKGNNAVVFKEGEEDFVRFSK